RVSLGIFKENASTREILGWCASVIDLGAHGLLESFEIFRATPLQRGDLGRDRDRSQRLSWRVGLGEQEAGGFDAVAHHIVEDTAALAASLPEPGAVRPAMLLSGARQIGAAGERRAAPPDDFLPSLHGRCEDLILQVSMQQVRLLDQL